MKKIFDYPASVRLLFILLIVGALLSLPGIFIPQGLSSQAYQQNLGPFWSKILLFWDFNDVFNSVLFNSVFLSCASHITRAAAASVVSGVVFSLS